MKCIFCQNADTDVIETRVVSDGTAIRRRRQCPKCGKRFTTYERVEFSPILVIKRDGRRERFSAEKLKSGILKATGKTKITAQQIDEIVQKTESTIRQKDTTEVESKTIGQIVARQLKRLDKVAYIRFASVFKRFVDIDEFEKELKKVL